MGSHTLAPVLLLFALSSAYAGTDPVSVSQAWVRAGPPSVSVYAGYLVLHNHSDQAQTIVGVSSPRFTRIEIHRTEIEDGVARMVKQTELVIRAKGVLKLEPGGAHLMLIGPSAVPNLDERIPARLELAHGAGLDFELAVRTTPPDT